jgi:hypothetical protein
MHAWEEVQLVYAPTPPTGGWAGPPAVAAVEGAADVDVADATGLSVTVAGVVALPAGAAAAAAAAGLASFFLSSFLTSFFVSLAAAGAAAAAAAAAAGVGPAPSAPGFSQDVFPWSRQREKHRGGMSGWPTAQHGALEKVHFLFTVVAL